MKIPKFIGEQLLADEIHRTIKNKNLKYILVTDSLSRFSNLYYFDENMNTEKFTDLIIFKVLREFCSYKINSDSESFLIRRDNWSSHKKKLHKNTLGFKY